MKYKEFLEYLEINLQGYKTFMGKALQYQRDKILKRQPSKRWNDEKLQRAAYDMWKTSMQTLYNNLKSTIKSDSTFVWKDYIEKNEIQQSINESISDLDFNEVA